jgi:periplasmic copper chaperone A
MLQFRNTLKAIIVVGAMSAFAPLSAHEFKAGGLTIDHPWTRETPAGAKTAAGYLKIINKGNEVDRLVSGSAEGVDAVEVHEMAMDNNVMKMRRVEGGTEIKPGQTVEFKPSSYHLMMIGLKEPFKKGNMIKGTLTFEKAGSVPVEFEVAAMGTTSSGHHEHKN